MAIKTFIENLLDSKYAYSESQLLQLKDLASKMHKLLDDIYSTRKVDVSRRTYTSISSYQVLQSYIYKMPDQFFNFRYNDVNISIVIYHSLYYVKISGFKVSKKSIQTVIDSQVLSDVNLFSGKDSKELLEDYQLDKVFVCDSDYIGGFQADKLDKIKLVYATVVQMYLNEICV